MPTDKRKARSERTELILLPSAEHRRKFRELQLRSGHGRWSSEFFEALIDAEWAAPRVDSRERDRRIADAVNLRTSGASIQEIANALGRSPRMINIYLAEAGITDGKPSMTAARVESYEARAAERAKQMGVKPLSRAERLSLIQRMRAEGRTMQEIGDHVGLSRQRVHKILQEYDANTKSR